MLKKKKEFILKHVLKIFQLCDTCMTELKPVVNLFSLFDPQFSSKLVGRITRFQTWLWLNRGLSNNN